MQMQTEPWSSFLLTAFYTASFCPAQTASDTPDMQTYQICCTTHRRIFQSAQGSYPAEKILRQIRLPDCLLPPPHQCACHVRLSQYHLMCCRVPSVCASELSFLRHFHRSDHICSLPVCEMRHY